MSEENRVFDVSKPGYGSPQATSKPVIVGHRPTMNDPMVRGGDDTPAPTKISVHDAASGLAKPAESQAYHTNDYPGLEHHGSTPQPPRHAYDSDADAHGSPAIFAADEAEADTHDSPHHELEQPVHETDNPTSQPFETEPLEPLHPGHVDALEPSPHRRRSPLKWLLLLILVAAVAGYLLIDSGVIKSSIKLPFHIFKQKTPTPAATTPSPSSAPAAQASLPAGFTKYTLAGTDISFASPTTWGQPALTNEAGYSQRGANKASDGTHAYLVTFPDNADVVMVVTSNKYLPTARDTTYYDYLQWCTGTADGKIYTSRLQYTTSADKIDTPTTVSCDQGPLTDATKLNQNTIFEPAVKNTSGQDIGDIYTMNLTDPNLPVLRIKDAKSANSTPIKQLLNTVEVTASNG